MARHVGRSPAEMSREEVRDYLRYLVLEREISRTIYVQTTAALRFLYRVTLDRPEMVLQPGAGGGVDQWMKILSTLVIDISEPFVRILGI